MTELTSLVPHTNTTELSSLIPLLIPRDNYAKNPNLIKWRQQLEKGLKGTNNTALTEYAKPILGLTYAQIHANAVGPSGLFNFIWTHMLPQGFDLLGSFIFTPGIYGFMTESGKWYLGSTTNLRRRLFSNHKNYPFNKGTSSKHRLFYKEVIELGWSKFQLFVMALVPDHLAAFQLLHPLIVLTDTEIEILQLLSKYHLTLVEQFYLDNMAPVMNGEKWANASSPNKGALGVVRSEDFKSNLSSQFLGRDSSEAAKIKIREARTGSKRSDATRAKMASSNGGVAAFVMDVNTSVVTEYRIKSDAAKALGISMRTLGRWADEPTRIYLAPKLGEIRVSLYPFE